MHIKMRELAIKDCFRAWTIKDISIFLASFADDAHYIESHGPAYRGIEQLAAWFSDWIEDNDVLELSIKKFYHINDVCICEWYFEYICGGHTLEFNGASIVTFDDSKIVELREFKSETENNYPYMR
ncbi:MAG: nuclear transport factor 2 family protein [Defluviitaleaceae bacterium]|nr:nuclear transport factor 2 family protein [Defluviitaleaceae bacterium]